MLHKCTTFKFDFSVPLFYFGSEEYRVDSAEKFVNVTVWRTGPDLSQDSRVTLRLTSAHSSADGAKTSSLSYSSGEYSTPKHTILREPEYVLSLAGFLYLYIFFYNKHVGSVVEPQVFSNLTYS